jgi:hypothetical protein
LIYSVFLRGLVLIAYRGGSFSKRYSSAGRSSANPVSVVLGASIRTLENWSLSRLVTLRTMSTNLRYDYYHHDGLPIITTAMESVITIINR